MKLVAMSVGELLEQIAWTIDFFTDLAVYRSIYASFWERSGREPS